MLRSEQTIFALSSGALPAGVAVLRVSGPAAGECLDALAGSRPPPRRARLTPLHHPATGDLLDQALTLWFPGPESFTGEDVAEFHLHGGRAVVQAVSEALATLPGLSPAEPGEFSRRAFEHGKFDLTQAEGIADLVAAETDVQRRQALRQTAGELGALYEEWRHRLVRVLALAEADIDFAEEEALPPDLGSAAAAEIGGLQTDITRHLDDGHRGERLRDGIYVVIVGPANAGKSSLLNALARRDAAIVSATAGTTRDVVEVHLDIAGYPVIVADTAGLREAGDDIESEGVRRALQRADEADLRVVLLDAQTWPEIEPGVRAVIDDRAIVAVNKTDLVDGVTGDLEGVDQYHLVSVLDGTGMEGLVGSIEEEIRKNFAVGAAPGLTRLRHREALQECGAALERYLHAEDGAEGAAVPELAAEDLRLAMRSLGRITGQVDVEDLLDVVFREFCIGK